MEPEARPAIDHALYSHLNRAIRTADPLDSCELRFLALNVLFSAYDDWNGEAPHETDTRSQHRSLQRLMTTRLSSDDRCALIDHWSVARLAELPSPILDHDKLRRFRLSDEIPDDVRERASLQYATLVRRLKRLSDRRNARNRDAALNALADVLWMVRSNVVHGEKTLVGPDPQRNQRNRAVAERILSVLDAVLDEVLGHPSVSLVVYGTMVPGGVNESVLAGMEGAWEDVEVQGSRWIDERGLPRFQWQPWTGPPVAAKLFRSSALPGQWSHLDRFEGRTYRRILVRYSAGTDFGVANCYENSA
jgi:hypothetical protein